MLFVLGFFKVMCVVWRCRGGVVCDCGGVSRLVTGCVGVLGSAGFSVVPFRVRGGALEWLRALRVVAVSRGL